MDIQSLGIVNFWVFVTAGIILNITPGQDTIYIVTRSVAEGRISGLASALGVSTGGVIHLALATLGLSAIITTSPAAFAAVKLLGAAYLVYLGVDMLLRRQSTDICSNEGMHLRGVTTTYRRGIVTNLLNPKVAMFFLAFLPQFIDATSSYRPFAFFVLGSTFVFTGTVWCLVVATIAARMSRALRRSTRAMIAIQRLAGVIFVGLGARLALERSRN